MSGSKPKSNGKPKAQPKSASTKNEVGYKGHRKDSRKEAVHKVYDKSGAEAAIKHGETLKLKPSTLRSWCQAWARKPAAKKAA
jgi:hypothetical protein